MMSATAVQALAQARLADLRYQAHRAELARSARQARRARRQQPRYRARRQQPRYRATGILAALTARAHRPASEPESS